jgi:hypothetical protein
MSRPTVLSSALAKKLCTILSEGNTIETACGVCGITDRTFHNWMTRGEEEQKGPFFQFFHSATRARAKAKAKLVKVIIKAADRDWKAASFLLERMHPAEFGRTGERPVPQQESKEIDVQIIYNTTKPMSELLDFPTEPGANI